MKKLLTIILCAVITASVQYGFDKVMRSGFKVKSKRVNSSPPLKLSSHSSLLTKVKNKFIVY